MTRDPITSPRRCTKRPSSSRRRRPLMEIFADTSDVTEIGKWLRRGILDGVTTNPSIMLKDGVRDMEKAAREIAEVLDGRPVSVEVTSNDPDEMLAQARTCAKWAPNIVVKIPVITEDGGSCV